jgi:hypothetical protein
VKKQVAVGRRPSVLKGTKPKGAFSGGVPPLPLPWGSEAVTAAFPRSFHLALLYCQRSSESSGSPGNLFRYMQFYDLGRNRLCITLS